MSLNAMFPNHRTFIKRHLILFILVSLLWGCAEPSKVHMARQGKLDLRTWNFNTQGMVILDGQWEFYWNHLLAPSDFKQPSAPPMTGYLAISKLWPDKTAAGTATFRLNLSLGPDRGLMGLELSGMTAAYRLWIDDTLLAEQGQVGEDRDSERPSYGRQVMVFQPPKRPFTLTLQLSSHNMMGGLLPKPHPLLGTRAQLVEKSGNERRQAVVLLGIFLLMAVYHLLLFLFYPRDLSTLYFAVYCSLWLVNAAISYIAIWLMPAVEPLISARQIYATDLFSYYLSLPAIALFLRTMFPDEIPVGLTRLALGGAALFILGILILGTLGFAPLESRLPQSFHLLTLVCMAWSILGLARAFGNRRSGSGLILTAFVILTMVGLNDILHDLKVINTGFYNSQGMLLFIVFQSFALARRFSRAFTSAEALAGELQEKNRALARMDRLKDEFLANTSHELRTPLSGIIGISESLLAGAAGALPRSARQNLEMVAGSGRRLSALINDILDFTRLRHRDMPLDLRDVDVRAVTDAVLTLLAPLAREKQLGLVNLIPRNLVPVKADEDRVQQILYNLIGNAIKFSDKGEIRVTARVERAMVAFSVSDQGGGIPEELHQEIFQPFKQGDAGLQRSHQGLGLGLAITTNLVRLHGGDLHVESHPGRGSTFTFTLPKSNRPVNAWDGRVQPPRQRSCPLPCPEIAPSPVLTDTGLSGLDHPKGQPRILIVDDDPVNCQVLVNHLHLEGFAVDVATGGIPALERVSQSLPDLVLLDIMMPGMNGYEVCQRLRQNHSPSQLPVVMLTAKTRVKDIVQGFACGANDYLTKPFEKDELLARVRTLLQLRQAYQTLEENVRLKRELARRRQTELDLRLNQRRLAHLLDTVDDMVITVNQSREISFCNQTAADVLGYDGDQLLGNPLDLLFAKNWVRTFNEYLLNKHLQENDPAVVSCTHENLEIHCSDGSRIRVAITITVLAVDDEQMLALIIRRFAVRQDSTGSPSPKTLALIDDINRHQERLNGLEISLNGLFPQLKNMVPQLEQEIHSLDQALDAIQKKLVSAPPTDRRGLGVLVMQLSLDYWYDVSNRDKADLARESGIWKLYTDRNGYTRTQTLDKYLSEETLPRQPRWKWISQTAVYVLAACTTPSPLRDGLEAALARFRTGE